MALPGSDGSENPRTLSPKERLLQIIANFGGRPFAVVDGAQFDDVEILFKRDRIFARSLYLDSADAEICKAGPWLVDLRQSPEATRQIVALVGGKPAAIYWSCKAGERTLWHHLRGINLARIPQWAARGGTAPFYNAKWFPSETVFFRHYDPRTLHALLPCLDGRQFRKILGPAEEIAFVEPSLPALKRVVSDPSWPPAPPGLLTVTSPQLAALSERRRGIFGNSISQYLRHVAPEIFEKIDPDRARAFTCYSERTGRALGISSEAAHCRWAYLLASSGGKVLDTPGAIDFITDPARHPNSQVEVMMRRLAEHLRT